MAVLAQRPAPPIWPHPRGEDPFLPPLGAELLVAGVWTPAPALLLALGNEKDRSALSGRCRLTLPAGRLVLRGRGRGDFSRVTLGGQPLVINRLGLDAAPPGVPRGYHPFAARTEAGGTLLLDLQGFVISQLRARLR